MKKIMAVLILMALICSSALASNVRYQGGAEDFVFLPGSEDSDTDLFENFKNVLPGDEITQIITVKNTTGARVRIYLRAEPGTKADEDFLSQMNMTVSCRNSTIFDAAPSETAQLTNNRLLGTFKKNGSTDLIVTLSVPEDMGNEYMGMKGTVPWTFLVENVPSDGTPDTSDWFQLYLWCGLAVLLSVVFVLLVVILHRRRREEH